jgi:hypothetical protein
MAIDYSPQIYAMADTDLEVFVNKWLDKKKTTYVSAEHFSSAGDMGRDVVGYCTAAKLDGEWHNYQCKQFRKESLRVPAILAELGKILFHASRGEFGLPERYFFVAPRGVDRGAKNLLASPSKLKAKLIADWGTACAKKIKAGEVIAIDAAIQEKIDAFKFENVDAYNVQKLLVDPDIMPALVACFGADPGPPPLADTSKAADWGSSETTFAHQLVSLYGHHDAAVTDRLTASAHVTFGPHLRDQFIRYFEADSFKRHYRDNTPTGYVEAFEQEVRHGVQHTYNKSPADSLERVDEVTDKAGILPLAGHLGKHAGIRAKQGICHHLVNADELKWKS